jgi:dCMP deaminase
MSLTSSLSFSSLTCILRDCTGPYQLQTLTDFVQHNDRLLYEGTSLTGIKVCQKLHNLMEIADVLILNTGSRDDFIQKIHTLDLLNKERLRPSWDTYFMLLAELAARRSNCMKRRVGAMLVKESMIVTTGYNGTPRNTRNCQDGGCSRCNMNAGCAQHLDQCLCIHAEENALLEAGRDRAKGATLYCNTCPCLGCAKKIVQAGVNEVIYATDYGMDKLTTDLFREAGVLFRHHRLTTSRHLSCLAWQTHVDEQ